MIYAATLSESQIVMLWKLILGDLVPNIQHTSGVGKIVSDMLSRFPSTSVNKYEPITMKDRCCANELFTTGRV